MAVAQRTSWVMLSTHNRLAWFNFITGELRSIHDNHGVYYGVSAGDFERGEADTGPTLSSVWVVQRPHNVGKHSKLGAAQNYVIQIALKDNDAKGVAGEVLQKVPIRSQFTHDSVQDGNHMYICDTGHGHILHYEWQSATKDEKESWKLQRSIEAFTRKDHINTIEILDSKHFLVMLHNHGAPSYIAKLDRDSGAVVDTYRDIGSSAHGCSPWRDHVVFLDSPRGALVKLPLDRSGPAQRFFSDTSQPPKFAKGLLVIGDVAIFGLSKPTSRESRASRKNNADIVVFDLVAEKVLLHVPDVQTHGLLNAITAPQLSRGLTA